MCQSLYKLHYTEWVKSEDFELVLVFLQDVDDFFEHERTFLVEYHNRVKDASAKSDKMTRSHKSEFSFQKEKSTS